MRYFGKEWYLNGCDNKNVDGVDKFFEYEEKYLPKWYNDKFSIHDSKIVSVKRSQNLLEFTLLYDDYNHTEYKIKFFNPEILELCQLIDSFCISDEIYVENSQCEFHLMCDIKINEIYGNLHYFTVKCSKIEIAFDGNICIIESKIKEN